MPFPSMQATRRDDDVTFCSTCGNHFTVGEKGEFIWADTNERVGT